MLNRRSYYLILILITILSTSCKSRKVLRESYEENKIVVSDNSIKGLFNNTINMSSFINSEDILIERYEVTQLKDTVIVTPVKISRRSNSQSVNSKQVASTDTTKVDVESKQIEATTDSLNKESEAINPIKSIVGAFTGSLVKGLIRFIAIPILIVLFFIVLRKKLSTKHEG